MVGVERDRPLFPALVGNRRVKWLSKAFEDFGKRNFELVRQRFGKREFEDILDSGEVLPVVLDWPSSAILLRCFLRER